MIRIRILINHIVFILSLLISFSVQAQDGPGGVGNSDGSSDLMLWLRADKYITYDSYKEISSWNDYSGNGIDFVNSTTKPTFQSNVLNQWPSVYFSEAGAGLKSTSVDGSDIFSSENNTFYFVAKGSSGDTWFNWSSSDDTVSFGQYADSASFSFQNRTTGKLNDTSDITDGYYIIGATVDASDQTFYINGANNTTQATDGSIDETLASDLFLGTRDGSSTHGWTGHMTEMLVFNSTLNAAQRTVVENYLSAKYNLPLTAAKDVYGGDTVDGDFDYDVAGVGQASDGSATSTRSNSAGVYISKQSGFDAGEFAVIGHDNSIDSVSTQDLPTSSQERWNRSWYLDTADVDGMEVKIAFDFSEGIDGSAPSSAEDYVLLRRENATGDFEVVSYSASLEEPDQVYFTVSDLTEGYYTLGTEDKINSPVDGSKTWYTYKSGPWDEYSTWTQDPDGSLLLNDSKSIPGVSDTVVVLNGDSVALTKDNRRCGDITIRSGGRVYVEGTTLDHDFTSISGEGRIQLEDDNFPAGDTTDFINSGIVEYKGGGYSLSEHRAYYDLIINLADPSSTITLKNDLTVNNDFTVSTGDFQINDGTDDVKYNISVLGDVIVQSDGKITVGTGDPNNGTYVINGDNSTLPDQGKFHDFYHQFHMYGDLTNHGTIRFTNQSAPEYSSFTDNGAVTARFKGKSDNIVKLYNTTDFYFLIVDKGTDKSYTLELHASETDDFELYGPNSVGRLTSGFDPPFSATNPEVRKALWIYHGTLKIGGNENVPDLSAGNVIIPTLSEGNDHEDGNTDTNGDYAIGEYGALWIAGDNVEVYSTALGSSPNVPSGSDGIEDGNGHQGFGILGELKISAGTFGTRNSFGIVYRPVETGQLIVTGGSVDASQLRSTWTGDGKFSYIQSGGTVTLRGDKVYTSSGINDDYGIFDLGQPSSVFQMTGGEMIINDVTGTAPDFYINCDKDNSNVTGGKLTFEINGGETFDLHSKANFWNMDIKSLDGDPNAQVLLDTALTVSNNLLIDDNTELNASGNNYDVTIGGDFTLGLSTTSNANYNAQNNTTTFNGAKNSLITIANDADAGTFNPYDMVIDKTQFSYDVSYSTNKADGDTVTTVDDDFRVERGVFDYGSYLVNVKDSVFVQDTLGPPSSQGRIILNNSSNAQNIISSSLGNPYIGHGELNNTNGANLSGDLYLGKFTLNEGIMNIGEDLMSVDDDEILGDNTFDNTRMIKTAGNSSDEGLQYNFNLFGDYTSDTIVYPIGTDDGGNVFTPAYIVIENANGLNDSGSYRVNPVPEEHPSTDPSFGYDVLPYYWKTERTGFESLNELGSDTISLEFEYHSLISADGFGVSGWRMYFNLDGQWWRTADAYDDFYRLQFNQVGFIEGDFTTAEYSDWFGDLAFLDYQTYYSYNGGGQWGQTGSWSLSGHNTLDEPGALPGEEDLVIIGDQDSIYINNDGQAAGQIYIRSGSVLDINSTINHNFTDIKKGGKFRSSTENIPAANYGDLVNNDTAIFEYYGDSYNILGDLATFPNLWITGNPTNASTKTLPDADILVQQNLKIGYSANPVTLTLSNTTNGDMVLEDSVFLDNSGKLLFQDDGPVRSMAVHNSILMNNAGDSITVAPGGDGNEAHNLYVEDDIHVGPGKLILRKPTNRGVDLTFKGDSLSELNATTDGTVDLNKLIVDKNNTDDTVKINTPFSLDQSEISLLLEKGVLVLNDPGIDVTLSSGDNGEFEIPEGTSLILRNGATARINGDNGLYLAGKLKVEDNSSFLLENHDYIEYASSGTGQLVIEDQATLSVGAQLRRETGISSGALTYKQSGGTVTVGVNAAPTTERAVFEVLNSSSFTYTGGNLTIVQSQSKSQPAIYLEPDNHTLAGGATITIGSGKTPADDTIGIYSSIPLKDVEVANETALVYTQAITMDSLITNTGKVFDANGYDITLNGNLHTEGSYTTGDNTTNFTSSGGNQYIIGDVSLEDVVVNTADSVKLHGNTDITVNGDLSVSSGTLFDNSNVINVKANVTNDAKHAHGTDPSGGMIFNGTVQQEVSGSGTFGRMELDNSKGVLLKNDLTLTEDSLIFTNGPLYIQNHLLTLGENTGLRGPFNEDKMIVTNGVYSDKGVQMTVPAGASEMTFPVGVYDKYTPVDVSVSQNNTQGTLSAITVNEAHPTVTDPDNVLQYYWSLKSSNLSDFSSVIQYHYNQEDVSVTDTSVESDYIPAYLKDTTWQKFDPNDVDATYNIIEFGLTRDTLTGDYTAGVDEAIPDNVPVYKSQTDGDWNEPTIWKVEGETASNEPDGNVVEIYNAVNIVQNLKTAYQTHIDTGGRLDIGTTFGHYLGEVSGYGTLKQDFGNLPAGNYEEFFACDGGTMIYGGSDSYTIPNEGSTYRRIVFTGSGSRSLPDNDFTICDTLLIDGPTVDNSLNNNQITMHGVFKLQSGKFLSGTGSNATVIFNGTSPQHLQGDFTGTNALNNLTINTGSTVTLSQNILIESDLSLTEGIINADGNTVILPNTASVIPSGGQGSSFVSGVVQADLDDGANFTFPVGKGDRYGKTALLDISTSNTQTWTAEYMNENPDDQGYNTSSLSGDLEQVSGSQYWKINSPAGDAKVRIRWDSQSEINGLSVDPSKIRIAKWDGSQWVEKGSVTNGTGSSGTVETDSALAFSNGETAIFTLATTTADLAPSATITSSDSSFCVGDSAGIAIDLTGDSPWGLGISSDAGYSEVFTDIVSSDTTIYVNDGGTYALDSVKDSDDPWGENVSGSVEMTENANPTADIYVSTSDSCENVSLTLNGSGSSGNTALTYSWSSNPASDIADTNAETTTAVPSDGNESSSNTFLQDYYLTVTDENGCQDETTNNIEIYQTPVAEPDQTGSPLCYGNGVVDLDADSNTDSTNYDYYEYSWSPADSIPGQADWEEPEYEPGGNPSTAEENFYMKDTIFNANNRNCYDVDSVQVNILRRPETGNQYYVPNEFDQ